MGTDYYLIRDNNRTVFDLGKAYGLASVWRDRARKYDAYEPVPVDTGDLEQLRRDIISAFGKRWDGSMPLEEYAAELAQRIARFADGHTISLVSEYLDETLDGFRDETQCLRIVDSRFVADWRQPP